MHVVAQQAATAVPPGFVYPVIHIGSSYLHNTKMRLRNTTEVAIRRIPVAHSMAGPAGAGEHSVTQSIYRLTIHSSAINTAAVTGDPYNQSIIWFCYHDVPLRAMQKQHL